MFSNDFFWGAASASYQIEGAHNADGKGKSVWDAVSEEGRLICEGSTGNMACDHYNRYAEDILLMKEIGLKAYRLSMSWPRILPEGTGRVNPKGLDFYDRLIDGLLEKNIEPFITLFHWDYPWELFLKGGWTHPDSSRWFEEYSNVVCRHFKNRVKYWMTLNEPQCFILLGHMTAEHAPCVKLPKAAVLVAMHNTLLAHGRATQAIRSEQKDAKIGYAPVGTTIYPRNEAPSEIEWARKRMFSGAEESLWSNAWWMDPVYLGKYPEAGLKAFERIMPPVKGEDMAIISEPLDFFGCNIYNGRAVEEKDGALMDYQWPDGAPKTAMDWRVTPEALYWGPRFFYERYKKPIIITENGIATHDWIMSDGRVHDLSRIDFMSRYIHQMKRAAMDGVDIKGYFAWSAMDNLEWAFGYDKRFGLIHVDFATQKRTLKDSAYWYRKVIESNGNDLSIDYR